MAPVRNTRPSSPLDQRHLSLSILHGIQAIRWPARHYSSGSAVLAAGNPAACLHAAPLPLARVAGPAARKATPATCPSTPPLLKALGTAMGSVARCGFLMMVLVNVVQVKLGFLVAVVPLVLVPAAMLIYIDIVFYAFSR